MEDNELELQSIVFSDEYREIEERLLNMAKEMQYAPIDRSLPYQEQGIKSHINELAGKEIEKQLKLIRKEKEDKFLPPPSYE